MATMSSLSDDGYEEDEESNVSKISLEVRWGSGGGPFWAGPLGSSCHPSGTTDMKKMKKAMLVKSIWNSFGRVVLGSVGGLLGLRWGSIWGPLGATMSSMSNDGYEEDEKVM